MSESKHEENGFERIEDAVIESEQFLEKYQKQIFITLAVVVVAVAGYLAYNHFISKPKTNDAQVAMFKGEEYFRHGADSLAIFGDGKGYIGFEEIISNYGSTKPGKLAKLYAGMSYARMGNTEKALSYLKGYSGNDEIISHLVNGSIGDCLVKTGQKEEAATYFVKAAKGVDNALQSPIMYKKAGEVYRELGQYDKVIEVFTTIQDRYTDSPLAMEATKYIEEAKLLKESK